MNAGPVGWDDGLIRGRASRSPVRFAHGGEDTGERPRRCEEHPAN